MGGWDWKNTGQSRSQKLKKNGGPFGNDLYIRISINWPDSL